MHEGHQPLRRISAPVHFVIERLAGGGWDKLAGPEGVPFKAHRPPLFEARHRLLAPVVEIPANIELGEN